MKIARKLLFFLFLASVSLFAADKSENHIAITFDPGPYPWKFVAYGDMRMTDPSNHHDTDPARRKAIIEAIATQHARFVAITGDLVLNGSNGLDWNEYDREMKPVLDSGATVFPALGNHEMHGDPSLCLANYFQRFPQLQQSRYYTVKAGNVLLITIDSEEDDPRSPQRKWLEGVMKTQVTRDIQFVVFSLHHPPYTHFGLTSVGHVARHEEKDMAEYLEKLQQHSRAKFLVIGGHNHNYERYEHNGVMYIVTGGGGASPYMPHRDPTDFYQGVGPTYHYCLITMEDGKLNFEMYKLTETLGRFGWVKADNFALTVQ